MSGSPPPKDPLSPDAQLRTDHLVSDIGTRSLRGGTVALAAQGIKVTIQIGTLVVLARLLPPAAFGLIAMAAALTALLDVVKEFGFSAVTIQTPDLSHDQVSSLFWMNAAAGSLIATVLFLGAPVLAHFYDQPDLVAVTRWLAVAFVFGGLTVQHWALLRRQMRFGAIAAVETGADIAGFVAALGVALAGGGYWALVAQRLAYAATGMIASWSLCRWRPGPPRRVPGLRRMINFGASVTGCYFAVVLARSVDQMLIGWLWGPAVLGAYERATKLLMLPLNTINGPVYAVAMPALSRLAGHEQRYRVLFREMIQKLSMLTMPIFALMAVTSDWIVRIVFGTQWDTAAPIAMWFGVAGIYLPVVIALGLTYQSQGRTGDMMRATLIDCGLAIAAVLAGLPFGVIGVAASFALTGLLIRTPVAFWLATRRGPMKLGDLYAAVAPAALAAITTAIAVVALRRGLLQNVGTATEGLALSTLVGLCVMSLTFLALPEGRRALLALRHLPQRLRS